VYRPPKMASIERELASMRARSKVAYIPANADVLWKIKDALRRGAGIGLLVDEHFSRGVDVVFFGRPCKVTPIFARFARQLDCPIYGGRIVRLPGGSFRLDITDPIPAPRDAAGKIDVAAAMQVITGVIEGWVREHPEQWLWLQRRWR
jgi:Kdo2-lipid IVA lauroyltransferase/acyltransferase